MRLHNTRQHRIRQDNTRQDNMRQDKTTQDNSRQHKIILDTTFIWILNGLLCSTASFRFFRSSLILPVKRVLYQLEGLVRLQFSLCGFAVVFALVLAFVLTLRVCLSSSSIVLVLVLALLVFLPSPLFFLVLLCFPSRQVLSLELASLLRIQASVRVGVGVGVGIEVEAGVRVKRVGLGRDWIE